LRLIRLTILCAVVAAMLCVAPSNAEEKPKASPSPEATPAGEPLYGDPECKVCNGTGRVSPQKVYRKGKSKQYIMYCDVKASGKSCSMLIGGWDICQSCQDLPGMAPLWQEKASTIAMYRENAAMYDFFKSELHFSFGYSEGVHTRLVTNMPHGVWHGVIDAQEQAWDIFAVDWGFLTPAQVARQPVTFDEPASDDEMGSMWDTRWRSAPRTVYLVSSKEEYDRVIDWYWENGGGTKDMGGKALLKSCQSCDISGRYPHGRLIYWNEEISTHCSLVHSFGHDFLRGVGATELPHWANEGFAKYLEYRTKNQTLTHCIEYGHGKMVDADWQDSGSWKGKLKEAAMKPSTYDDVNRKWNGLIPMDTLSQYKITNIPWEGMAESWGLVCYLMGEGQKKETKKEFIERFKTLLSGLSGRDHAYEKQDAAFKAAYGKSAAEVFELWKKWLAKW